ncbi:MAG: sulfatase [Candidatus Aminicenantes bacterium]|nr:sulfatase [Candidatus Aminicenantes bacterium]
MSGFLFISTGLGCGKTQAISPNVVVIVIDTLRADHLPFYGYKKNTAPFLNRLSTQSVIFEKAYSTSSLTAPATASLFTSTYPFQHGVVLNIGGTIKLRKLKPRLTIKLNKIPQEMITLGEVFKQSGYATFGVSDNINIGDKESFDQGFDKFATFTYQSAPFINRQIKKWANEIKKQKKYLLYIHYMDPHQPYYEREPWYKQQDTMRANNIAMYDSEINYVDIHIKELYELFGWNKNTLIILTSDHGEELWDHGFKGHGYSLYREVIHIPLMIYYPQGGFKVGRTRENVNLVDVLPTLREFLGLSRDKANEGISLLPVLKGRSTEIPQRFLFAHLVDHSFNKKTVDSGATIYKNWHFIEGFSGDWSLFNLKLDPREKYNQQENDFGTARQLYARYWRFKKKCRKFKQDQATYHLDEAQIERLKTLGYIR